jgi:hypothetical protein
MEEEDEDVFLMQQLAPANISGVHNYCDGWCERCGFTGRCGIYPSLSRWPRRPTDDSMLAHLKDRFDQVRTHVIRRSTFSAEEALKNIEEEGPLESVAYQREEARREEPSARPDSARSACLFKSRHGVVRSGVRWDACARRCRRETR